jgi:hypothetical protein
MRIRTVKPEFWAHSVISRLDDAAKLLAIGLLNLSDDEGFFFSDPILVRNALRPFDEDSTRTRRALECLLKVGWIELSRHSEHGFIGRVANFTKHQKIDRPTASKIESYFDSTSLRRNFDEGSLLEGKGKEGNGKDQGKAVDGEKEKAPKKVAEWNPTDLQLRIGSWFNRRPTTAWDDAEMKAFRKLGATDPEDLKKLEEYYLAKMPDDKDFRRHDLITLLNNWNGELDRARNNKPATVW